MKVKAVTNINYGKGWIFAGEVFEAKEEDLPELSGLVEAAEKPAARPAPVPEVKAPVKTEPAAEEAEPKKQTASRKKR